MRSWMILFVALASLVVINLSNPDLGWPGVVNEGERVLIVDRTGERWDITQAVSLGFEPDGFQFGIGRNAIRPLDASHLTAKNPLLDGGTRVIGVEKDLEAHAYAVRKLTRHEIANTELADTPIAAAY